MTRYVKYVGTSHWREITQKQWAALDPPVENPTLRWDAANGWTLPADKISEDAWPYIDADSELVIVEKDYRAGTTSTEDSAEADPMLYPPLTTAKQAEDLDQSNVDADVVAGETQLPDQETGSVADIRYTGGTKD